MTSEKLTATIKARAMKFALDNGFTHHVLLIEDAMLIGASIGLESQLESQEEPEDSFPGEDMDGDAQSALASAGFGTDEDYGGCDDRM